MALLASIVYYLGVCFAVLAGLAFLLRRFYARESEVDALHFVTTKDGWRLALGHYRPQASRDDALPVLLCPGVGVNTDIFESGEVSLVEYLRSAGFNVWTLDLRGRGKSSPSRSWGNRPSKWCFDDIVEFDLPAAVAEVCRLTGKSQIHCMGFGLGGSAAICSLEGGEHGIGRALKTVVSLGGPAFFSRQAREISPRLLSLLRYVPLRPAAELLVPLIGRSGWWPMSLLCNGDNVEGSTLRRTLVNAVERISSRELRQLVSWVELDQFFSSDGTTNYRDRLTAVRTPTLMVLGPRDRLAPPTMMQETFDSIGSDDKELLFAGREGGMSTNYGHFDLLFGRMAARDLFPKLAAWLDARHATRTGIERDRHDEPPAASEQEASEEESQEHSDPLELALAVGDVPNLPGE